MHVDVIHMTPFRPALVALLPPSGWSAAETIFAIAVVALSFVQKAHDHTHSGYTIFGLFSYAALVMKASVCCAVAWDGLYAALSGEPARPIATCVLFVLVVQQVRALVQQILLRRAVLGRPVAESSIIRMPLRPERN